ncbi:PREDICTED: interferon alpha-inducible protein 27, mitochondrial isoform X1 [Colobus angolensis palliatus]|uniref:interferon alpha-inducible protein 27, mitochondrial isoform X1 n=1 Tax=Colobus angolensis palliatus TaxID=336983 RepID=UPI0005F53BFD|nr:PREDICTED: interferon alpha-inducible protein 27, mitochondrial isoform X1 [Colobus angolensis palliatus]
MVASAFTSSAVTGVAKVARVASSCATCVLPVVQDCYSCDWRSCGRGGCAHGAQCHGLHCDGNHLVLHSSQDDVRSGHCQWGWSCPGQPCGHSAVTGSNWTLRVDQIHPGLHWVCHCGWHCEVLLAPCPSPGREESHARGEGTQPS